jgi:Methyltransferase domain
MFHHVAWPLHGFETMREIGEEPCTRFPIRHLRYWFTRSFLERLHAEVGESLSVLEVGIGDGKMLGFMGGPKLPDDRIGIPDWIERWDGLDVNLEPAILERFAYSDHIEADVEASYNLKGRRYHAVLLVHVLEHLFKPEVVMLRLRDALHEQGIIVGGSPTMPDLLALMHQPWLHWKHRTVPADLCIHPHISVITPGRIKRFARRHDWVVEHLAGAFFLRSSGLYLENFTWWMRTNLLWGAAFPALGGEVYFSLRRR